MPYLAVKRSYIGFNTEVARKLVHSEGDFEVVELVCDLREEDADLLIKVIGSKEFTLKEITDHKREIPEVVERVLSALRSEEIGDEDTLFILKSMASSL
ncbi:MAG: hypothetical protein J7J75_03110 [Euryarchaeota archaeon]|nr:hypothetical protein [Euryarchaeota archaeon]MCD6158615.1 hypothetical protein [Euryarchaeota archaeon]